MTIRAASCTALALLEDHGRPMPVHSIYGSSLNLQCGEHLVHVSDQQLGGACSLCVTTDDLEQLRGQRLWTWSAHALRDAAGTTAILMDGRTVRYCTSLPGRSRLSPVAPDRLARARARLGFRSWFDTGIGLDLGLPRLRRAIDALAGHDPAAVERVMDVVGLGAGLTPSADDALVGALCLLSAQGSLPEAPREVMTRRLREGAVGKTTDVSLSYLRLALRGAFSSPITRVVGHLADASSQADLDESVDSLSRLGAMSGMDTVWGIQLACDVLAGSPRNPQSLSAEPSRRRASGGPMAHAG
jgi:hypothetical protein